jgi:hypothetical protein
MAWDDHLAYEVESKCWARPVLLSGLLPDQLPQAVTPGYKKVRRSRETPVQRY